jgi:hypothetical protein
MIDIDTSDKKEQRNFGLVMAGAISLLGLIRFGLHWRGATEIPALPYYYFAVAIVFGVLGLIAPKTLKPIFEIWIKIAVVLNFIVTHVVLSIAFFFTVLPIGILMRVTGNDPLDRALDADATTYWQDAETPADDPEGYTKQY